MVTINMEEKKKQMISLCICPGCPSYKICTDLGIPKELLFCFESVGRSKCITKGRGCICRGCPVTKQLGLKNMYFCLHGSEKEQLK